MRNRANTRKRRGFTLVEVLIVVVILGILAATVLPQFSNASDDARESALVQDLQAWRSQLELYKFQHHGKYPGFGGTSNDVRDGMLKASKADHTTAAIGTAGYPFGPYFSGSIPPNPFTGAKGIILTTDVPAYAPDESAADATSSEVAGWIYNPVTGRVKANCEGVAADGVTNLSDL